MFPSRSHSPAGECWPSTVEQSTWITKQPARWIPPQRCYRCLADAYLAASDLISVAAGIPGPLDMKTGLVRSPTILSTWVDLDPAHELSTRLGRPIQVGNDANMGAHGELRFGAARGCRDFVYVKASHGIGAGLVLNGNTYRGTVGIAGEIGHTPLPDADNWCRCGNRGCLEAVVSISEVKRQITHTRRNPEADASDPSLMTISSDPVAARVITGAGRTLGRVLADLCNALNPEAIILGGELGTAGAPLCSASASQSTATPNQPRRSMSAFDAPNSAFALN